jgi:hypothetical protein
LARSAPDAADEPCREGVLVAFEIEAAADGGEPCREGVLVASEVEVAANGGEPCREGVLVASEVEAAADGSEPRREGEIMFDVGVDVVHTESSFLLKTLAFQELSVNFYFFGPPAERNEGLGHKAESAFSRLGGTGLSRVVHAVDRFPGNEGLEGRAIERQRGLEAEICEDEVGDADDRVDVVPEDEWAEVTDIRWDNESREVGIEDGYAGPTFGVQFLEVFAGRSADGCKIERAEVFEIYCLNIARGPLSWEERPSCW